MEQAELLRKGEITQAEYNITYEDFEATATMYREFFEKMSAEHPEVLFVC